MTIIAPPPDFPWQHIINVSWGTTRPTASAIFNTEPIIRDTTGSTPTIVPPPQVIFRAYKPGGAPIVEYTHPYPCTGVGSAVGKDVMAVAVRETPDYYFNDPNRPSTVPRGKFIFLGGDGSHRNTLEFQSNGIAGTTYYIGMAADHDSNVVAAYGGLTNEQAILEKYNKFGARIWQRRFASGFYSNFAACDPWGNIAASGGGPATGTEPRLYVFDRNGSEKWSKAPGGGVRLIIPCFDRDGNVWAGVVDPNSSGTGALHKYSPFGQLLLIKPFPNLHDVDYGQGSIWVLQNNKVASASLDEVDPATGNLIQSVNIMPLGVDSFGASLFFKLSGNGPSLFGGEWIDRVGPDDTYYGQILRFKLIPPTAEELEDDPDTPRHVEVNWERRVTHPPCVRSLNFTPLSAHYYHANRPDEEFPQA